MIPDQSTFHKMFTNIEEYILIPKSERQAHVDLADGCICIGGSSTEARLLLAHYLKTTLPSGMRVHCCHLCPSKGCSNPKHLYWGTAKENMIDNAGGVWNLGASAKRGKPGSSWNKGMTKAEMCRN